MQTIHCTRNAARALVTLIIIATAQGCASSQQASVRLQGGTTPGTRTLSGGQRLTADELRTSQEFTALQALRQLRPEFLLVNSRSRGRMTAEGLSVFKNGNYFGGLDALDTILTAEVVEIQRLSEARARELFGWRCSCDGGVITVETRR